MINATSTKEVRTEYGKLSQRWIEVLTNNECLTQSIVFSPIALRAYTEHLAQLNGFMPKNIGNGSTSEVIDGSNLLAVMLNGEGKLTKIELDLAATEGCFIGSSVKTRFGISIPLDMKVDAFRDTLEMVLWSKMYNQEYVNIDGESVLDRVNIWNMYPGLFKGLRQMQPIIDAYIEATDSGEIPIQDAMNQLLRLFELYPLCRVSDESSSGEYLNTGNAELACAMVIAERLGTDTEKLFETTAQVMETFGLEQIEIDQVTNPIPTFGNDRQLRIKTLASSEDLQLLQSRESAVGLILLYDYLNKALGSTTEIDESRLRVLLEQLRIMCTYGVSPLETELIAKYQTRLILREEET